VEGDLDTLVGEVPSLMLVETEIVRSNLLEAETCRNSARMVELTHVGMAPRGVRCASARPTA